MMTEHEKLNLNDRMSLATLIRGVAVMWAQQGISTECGGGGVLRNFSIKEIRDAYFQYFEYNKFCKVLTYL